MLVVKIFVAVEGVTPRAIANRSTIFGSKFESFHDVSSRCRLVISIASVYFAAHQSHARVGITVTTSHATNTCSVVVSCGNSSCNVRAVPSRNNHIGVAIACFGSIEVASVDGSTRRRVNTLPCRSSQVFVFEVDTRVHYRHNHIGIARFFLPSREEIDVGTWLKGGIYAVGSGVMPLIFQVGIGETQIASTIVSRS